METVFSNYLLFKEYSKAVLIAIQLSDWQLVLSCLNECNDPLMKKQLAYIIARQQVILVGQ